MHRSFYLASLILLSGSTQTILDINEARDDGIAMSSAGSYANHLHLTTDK